MNKHEMKVKALCLRSLKEIDEAIKKHELGYEADLSVPVLNKVKGEVEKMLASLDPQEYLPSYARFILDF